MNRGRKPSPPADRVSLVLHGGLGFIIGLALGFYVAIKLNLNLPPSLILSAGGGLTMLSVGAWKGDQLWLGSSLHVVPTDTPRQSHRSIRILKVICGLGILLMLGAVAYEMLPDF